jgi:hypothetical protein
VPKALGVLLRDATSVPAALCVSVHGGPLGRAPQAHVGSCARQRVVSAAPHGGKAATSRVWRRGEAGAQHATVPLRKVCGAGVAQVVAACRVPHSSTRHEGRH